MSIRLPSLATAIEISIADTNWNARVNLKPGSVILHPLARNNELSEDLDDTDHNLYFAQAAGAVFVRQALLTAVLDRLDRVTGL